MNVCLGVLQRRGSPNAHTILPAPFTLSVSAAVLWKITWKKTGTGSGLEICLFNKKAPIKQVNTLQAAQIPKNKPKNCFK